MKIKFHVASRLKSIKTRLVKGLMLFTCFFLASVVNVYAQTNAVSGTILDEYSDPLIGVSVSIEGTTNGTLTDVDGKYTIAAKEGSTIVFSYVGMKNQTARVGSQSTINIILKEDVNLLTETVVIGYGSAKKRDLTGSIVRVDAVDIRNKPSANPAASLQGKVAGVQIVNTGRAGQDPEIRIRGTNSIGNYKPLYIVDGLFSENIGYLNPNDIESMDILKDPSSLAIFGIKGANGVIIITTKKAKEGQTIVNINSSLGFKYAAKRMKLTNAEQFKTLYNEQLSQLKADPFDYSNWNADTDWQDAVLQTGFVSNNNISITGASEKNRFYLGVGYQTEEGIVKSEKYNRITVNLSSDYNVNKFVRFGFQVNGARMSPPDAKGVDRSVKAAPIAPIYGTYTDPLTGNNIQLNHVLPSFQSAQLHNPMLAIDLQGNKNRAQNYRVAGNIYGEVDFLKDFNFRATFSLDYQSNQNRMLTPILWVYNPAIGANGDKENLNDGQGIEQKKSTDLIAQQDYILTYTKKINKHSITATGGLTTHYRDFSELNGNRFQTLTDGLTQEIPLGDPDFWWLTILPETSAKNGSSQKRRFTMSYLLRALYSYENKYLLNASYRRDGSSIFRGVGNTWGNFYSVGAGWVVSQEKFMQNIKEIDYLKLKGSYGVLGSENSGDRDYPTYPDLKAGASAIFGDNIIQGYSPEYNVANLGWEKTHAWEIGLELQAFNQRLSFDPTFYNKTTKDIIVLADGINGGKNDMENLGEIRNQGFELSASWNDKIGRTGIGYRLSANFTTINNKVLSIGRGDLHAEWKENSIARTMKGYSIGHFYGYKVVGVYQNEEDIRQHATSTIGTVKPGDLKFADLDGDEEITLADKTIIGKPTPNFTYGFSLGLDYKGFDFSIDMMGIYGNEIYRLWDLNSHGQFNYRTARMDRWHGEGTSNWEPILDTSRAINKENSSYYVEDGSFFRIRNIQFGYTFDPLLLQKIRVKGIRLYTNIENPKTWSKNSGYTPEIGGGALDSGFDKGTYPIPVSCTFGVNITF